MSLFVSFLSLPQPGQGGHFAAEINRRLAQSTALGGKRGLSADSLGSASSSAIASSSTDEPSRWKRLKTSHPSETSETVKTSSLSVKPSRFDVVPAAQPVAPASVAALRQAVREMVDVRSPITKLWGELCMRRTN